MSTNVKRVKDVRLHLILYLKNNLLRV